MKIAHISFSLMNGGKENMMVDIANEQQKLGHQVAVVIINNKIDRGILERIDPGIRIFEIDRKAGSKSPAFLMKLFTVLNFRFKASVVHAHDVQIGGLVKKLSGSKAVLTVHGPGIEVSPMRKFDRVFYISRSVQEDVEKQIDLNGKIIYNGIYTGQIKQKESYPVNKSFKIVHVKRLTHKRKGQDLLIKAMDELVHRKGYHQLRLDFIGAGESYEFLQNMIRDHKLEKEIRLLGKKDRDWIYEHLCDYDVFVHPSRFEGFGLTVAEAMLACIPVISSNIEGPAEILDHGKFGFLFENEDVVGLVDRVEDVLKRYADGSVSEITEKAYRRCIEHYDIRKTAENYCDAYPV